MNTQLPSLGRNPFNVLRILSGCERQSNDYVAASAEFVRGMVGKQSIDSDGNIEWSVYDGVTGSPAGILNSHKTSSIYKPIYMKPISVDASGNGQLAPYLLSGSVYIATAASGGSDITSEFTTNNTTGAIATSNGTYQDTTVYAAYRYLLATEGGIDETKGSNKVSVIRGVGELTTLLYDTSVPITAGAALYSASGILSATVAGTQVATCVQPPTYSNPELRIRIDL